jgi:hypothetical protein
MSADYEYSKSKGMDDRSAALVSLKNKKSKKSKKSDMNAVPAGPVDEYPYGLSLDLNTETMKKLGIKKLPTVGEKYSIKAEAKVRSISEHSSESDGGKPSRSLCLQITKMAVE